MEKILLNPTLFRPGSHVPKPIHVNFVITQGGIGDYLCWMSAILYLAKTHPQLHGHLFVPMYFEPIAKNLMSPYENWEVLPNLVPSKKPWTQNTEAAWFKNKNPTQGPFNFPINGTSCHLLDLGFIYYANLTPPPKEHNFYPELDLSQTTNPLPIDPRSYVVMTPGSTYANRTLPASVFNSIKEYCLTKSLIPIFLGKKEVGTRKINYEKDYDFGGGLDLREKTTLLQAAKIIADSKFIVGLDNGLLHLAACTPKVPIIFGYNIASPEHRRPRRRDNAPIYEIMPDEKILTCTFCQSKMRFMPEHDFAECIYKDLECLKMLSNTDGWFQLIDEAIKGEI